MERRISILGLALAGALAALARAQSYTVRGLEVADGLANSRVTAIHQDRHGFLWLATWEGVSRFDGAEVVRYGPADGFANPLVHAIAEDPQGGLWFATHGGGVTRLLDLPRDARGGAPPFESHRLAEDRQANEVFAMVFDEAGALWCATQAGLFRAAAPPLGGRARAAAPVAFERVGTTRDFDAAALAGPPGRRVPCFSAGDSIWIAEGGGLTRAPLPPDAAGGPARALLADGDGSLLVACERRVFRLARDAHNGGAWSPVDVPLDSDARVRALGRDSRGTLWVGTTRGLARAPKEGAPSILGLRDGLADDHVRCIAEDRDGNLWIGTWSRGAMKLSDLGVERFTTADGLPSSHVASLAESRDGRIYAVTDTGIAEIIGRSGPGPAVRVLPGVSEPAFHTGGARVQQDRRGDWWVGVEAGLFRVAGPELRFDDPSRVARVESFAGGTVFSEIYEDRAGLLWVGGLDRRVYVGDPLAPGGIRFRAFEFGPDPARTFIELPSGAMWAAPYAGLFRIESDRAAPLESDGPGPQAQPRAFHVDRRGRLWVGTRYEGAFWTDEPDAARPRFHRVSTRDGLSSDAIWMIEEDARGRLYFGTARGVDRFDPRTGGVRRLSARAGLAGDLVNGLLIDRRGALWVGSAGGVSRVDLESEPPAPAKPEVRILRVEVGGVPRAIPERGVAALDLELPEPGVSLSIDFSAPSFCEERDVQYAWRIAGGGAPWSAPTTQRALHFAKLATGDDRIEVRARVGDDAASAAPAVLHVVVPPPFWARASFLVPAAAALAAAGYAVHRARVRHLLALESVRRQIATDVHDDLGSGLSQVAILAEVAKREPPGAARARLEEMARLARSMRDSVGDIVWAVDPRRDHLVDLVQRVREVATNLLESDGVRVEVRAPPRETIERLELPPDRRRHLFLASKEALANVARHARAKHVSIDVELDGRTLRLAIRDDGAGFDPRAPHAGHGLSSLERRARELGGSLELDSAPGRGTTVRLAVPLP